MFGVCGFLRVRSAFMGNCANMPCMVSFLDEISLFVNNFNKVSKYDKVINYI